MKVKLENVGVLKYAEFEVGDFTIICGNNNTGKTYATYALYGFLDFWKHGYNLNIPKNSLDDLLSKGKAVFKMSYLKKNIKEYIDNACLQYTSILHKVFAAKESLFKEAKFSIDFEVKNDSVQKDFSMVIGSVEKSILKISKTKDSDEIVVSLMIDKNSGEMPPIELLVRIVSDAIKEILFDFSIPNVFISSAERTGSAIFQKELDFTRNRLLELVGDKSSEIEPFIFLDKFKADYPIPVRKNVDFIRALDNITNRESFILKNHPDFIKTFNNLISGEYIISKDGEIVFIPDNNKKAKLSLIESSSSVRSLLDVGFYLKHIAQPGDLLIVDEPELNLHPKNQRLLARLFVKLVNIGIKVFITTHSDYFIKELNTLIMLNRKSTHIEEFMKKEKYHKSEVLSHDRVNVYIAEKKNIKLAGNSRKSSCQTLVPAIIDSEYGINAKSFDSTIDEMNRIQEFLYFVQDGEDD